MVAQELHQPLEAVLAMPPKHLALWIAWFRDPRRRRDWQWAYLCSLQLAQGGIQMEPEDLLPDQEETAPACAIDAQDLMKAWATAFGKVIEKKTA